MTVGHIKNDAPQHRSWSVQAVRFNRVAGIPDQWPGSSQTERRWKVLARDFIRAPSTRTRQLWKRASRFVASGEAIATE